MGCFDLLLQLQMSKGKAKDRPKYNYLTEYTPPPSSQWNSDKIPPLISLTSKPEVKQSEIQIQSLNQSEVKSVYTLDKEDFDKQVLDIFDNSTERTLKEGKAEKLSKQAMGNTQPYIKRYETPVHEEQQKPKVQTTAREPLREFYGQPDGEYKDCKAVKLFNELVGRQLNRSIQSQKEGQSELEWMKAKSATEMLACVLTNASRMDLYVHYLLKEIHQNEQAKIINQLHQEQVRPYNPALKQVYTNILNLLSKINTPHGKKGYFARQINPQRNRSPSNQKERASISLYQNGLDIDLNPRLTVIRKQNSERIRQLKQKINQNEQQMQETRIMYQDIILNYAMTIENLNKGQQPQGTLHAPLQQSSVRLLFDQQEDQVRKKHLTFGMKDMSQRSSRNIK